MAQSRVEQELNEKLQRRLGVSRRQVNRRIQAKANGERLPRRLAAIVLAMDSGINVTRIATEEDLAALRATRTTSAHLGADGVKSDSPQEGRPRRVREERTRRTRSSPQAKAKRVFVVHGRELTLTKQLFIFLKAVGLEPIEWTKAIEMTGEAQPYVGRVLEVAFGQAEAVVVLLTPDDEARLRPALWSEHEDEEEKAYSGQPRQNVLFEAGLALGLHPDRTVVVQVGRLRKITDILGRHVLRLTNDVRAKREFVKRLKAAKCAVDESGELWMDVNGFEITPERPAPRVGRAQPRQTGRV